MREQYAYNVESQMFTIDMKSKGWGQPGTALLPQSLRDRWAAEKMPHWLCSDLGIPPGETFARLNASWNGDRAPARVLSALTNLFRSRMDKVTDLLVVQPTDRSLVRSIENAPFSTRSRNALARAGLLDRSEELAGMTFGQLMMVPALGHRSILDVSCVLETLVNDRREAIEQGAPSSSEDWRSRVARIAALPWAPFITRQDPRFTSLLSQNDIGSVHERAERLLDEPGGFRATLVGSGEADRFEALELEVRMHEALPLDAALMALLRAHAGERANRISALSVRFGWTGENPTTLEDAARPLGLTRERVRQIESKFLGALPHELYVPQLDRALNVLEAGVPLSLTEATRLLAEVPRLNVSLTPQAVLHTAKMFGRPTSLRVEDVKGKGHVIVGKGTSARDVAQVARKLAGMSGVASVYQVSARTTAPRMAPDYVRRLLVGMSHVDFLTPDWFWVTDIPSRRNRLANIVKKILSVAAPQSVASIREGVRRAFTYRSKSNPRYHSLSTPPNDVLTTFFARSPEFVLADGDVSPLEPLSALDELGEVDKALLDVFRATATGVLDRKAVIEACVGRGLNENSVSLFLTYSPIVEHAGLDIWKLRGVRVDPAAVEALRQANALQPTEKRLLSFGWRPDGKLWIAARLPYNRTSLVLGVPGTLKRYLVDSKFPAIDRDSGTLCGTISVNEGGTSFGYSTFLRISGAEQGDVMLCEYDLAARTVDLSLTEDSVLDVPDLQTI